MSNNDEIRWAFRDLQWKLDRIRKYINISIKELELLENALGVEGRGV